MTETVTKLLQRFVEAIDPENAQISKLQKDLDDARLKENEIKKVNPILEEEIKQAQSRQEGLVNLKNGIEKLIKENIGILDQEGRTEIYHNLVKQEKESYDNYEKQIKENKEKIATNEKILEDNSDILNFCGDEIQTAKKNIDNIVSKLKPIFEATGSENYIEIGKAKELISSLNVFSESEIGEILRYVSFPVPELKKIYEEYQLNKDDSKKTSMKQLFSDAQEAADKKEIEEKKQVKKVDKIDKIINEKKEEYKQIRNERYEDVLINTFKITEEDIKFSELIGNVTPTKLHEYADKLQKSNIDPSVVRMQTLIEDRVDNVIENKKIFSEYGYELDDMTIADRIADLDSAAPELTRRNLEIVTKCGLSLRNKNTGKIAVEVITREPKKLKQAINLCANIDISYFEENPSKMDDQVSTRMARVLYCQQNGENYKDEYNNFEKFIDNATEWRSIHGENIDKNIIPAAKECNLALADTLDNEVSIALNEAGQLENFLSHIELDYVSEEKCKTIIDNLEQANTSNNSVIITIGGESFLAASVYQNIRYLLSKGIDINDDILIGCLMFNTHTSPEAIKNIKLAIDPNTRGLK